MFSSRKEKINTGMDIVDSSDKTDKILEETKNILISNGAEFVGDEEIKMRIGYKNKSTEKYDFNPNLQTELYLFNRSYNNVSHVMCRNKRNEEDYDVIINEVDNHFLSITEKTSLVSFRQTYTIQLKTYRIGDLIFKLGFIFKDIFSKFLFVEIHNPFNTKYSEIKDFSYDVMNSLFNIPNLHEFCIFDSSLERLYKEEKLKTNNHWDILQYGNLIFKRFKF